MIANAGPRQENLDRQVILVKRSEDSHFGIVADGLGEIPEILASRLQALPGMLAGGNVLAIGIPHEVINLPEVKRVYLGV